MEAVGYRFDTKVRLHATSQEIDYMIDCSRHHYDWTCKEASFVVGGKVRTNGFLTIWKGHVQFEEEHKKPEQEPLPYDLSMSQLDLLCKIIENGENRDLYYKLREIARDATEKSCEVNGVPKPERRMILHPMIESKLCEKPDRKEGS